jgi:hypothetical protein
MIRERRKIQIFFVRTKALKNIRLSDSQHTFNDEET